MKKYIIPISVTILSFVICYFSLTGKQKPESVKLKIEAKVKQDDIFQLFYILDGGDRNWGQENSMIKTITGSKEYQTIEFEFPLDKVLDSVRIDWGVNTGQKTITVKGISLSALSSSINYGTEGAFVKNEYVTLRGRGYVLQGINGVYDPYSIANFNMKNDFLTLSEEQDKHPASYVYLLSLLIAVTLFAVTYVAMDKLAK
jgi:hypothetical protein